MWLQWHGHADVTRRLRDLPSPHARACTWRRNVNSGTVIFLHDMRAPAPGAGTSTAATSTHTPQLVTTRGVGAVQAALGVDEEAAEAIVRASEPLWDAMEQAGGLVNSWGGGEFCHLLPKLCAAVRD